MYLSCLKGSFVVPASIFLVSMSYPIVVGKLGFAVAKFSPIVVAAACASGKSRAFCTANATTFTIESAKTNASARAEGLPGRRRRVAAYRHDAPLHIGGRRGPGYIENQCMSLYRQLNTIQKEIKQIKNDANDREIMLKEYIIDQGLNIEDTLRMRMIFLRNSLFPAFTSRMIEVFEKSYASKLEQEGMKGENGVFNSSSTVPESQKTK